jgi:hypothetical protein
MGGITENLTRGELSAAVHAIGRGAGRSAFSPEYQTAIAEILAGAENAGLIRSERRVALERRIRGGVPAPESADNPVGADAEIYGFSILDGFLCTRDQSRPLLVVTWTTDFLNRVIQPPVSTADLVRARLPEKDRWLAETLEPILQTVRANIQFSGDPEDVAEMETRVLTQLVGIFRAGSDGAHRLRVHDLLHGGLEEFRQVAGDAPTDVIMIPPIHDANPVPLSFHDFAAGVLGPDGVMAMQYAEIEVGHAVSSTALPPGSRLLWFGNQIDFWGPASRPLRIAARRQTLENAEAIDVVHFPDSDGEDLIRSVPLGGDTLFVAHLGPSRCVLRVERARSWIDWFVRLRPERTWRGDVPRDAFVAVDPDEVELPWSHELFSPHGRAFRRQFLPFGAWVRLGTLGEFKVEFINGNKGLGRWRVGGHGDGAENEEEPDAGWKHGPAADSDAVRVRALRSDEIADVRNGTFDPDPDVGYYALDAGARAEWQKYLVKEGDLVFGAASLEAVSLPFRFAVVTEAAVGAIGAYEDGVTRFVFNDDTPAIARQWTVAFLQSTLADEWARALKYDELDEDFGPDQVFPNFLIPLPAPHWLSAYAQAAEAENRLATAARSIARLRAQVFEPQVDGAAAWSRLQNVSARANALNTLLGDVEDAELTIRFLHPYLIADGFRRIRTTADPEKRLRRVVELGEVTAGVLVSFWLTLERANPAGLPPALATALRERLRRGLTFGGLLQLIQQHLIPAFERSPLLPFLAASAVEAADRSLRSLNNIRNNLSHNRIPDRTAATAVLRQAEEAALDTLVALESLAVLQLVRVDQVEADPVSGRCRLFSGHVLAGDHPAGLPITDSPPDPTLVFPGHLYLRTPEGAMLPATPMFSLDPEAPEIGLGMIDRITSKVVEYRTPGTSRTWVDPNALEHLFE